MSEGKVLVIDDDVVVRGVLTDILQDEGYRVRMAASGQEGLACMKGDMFDVALVDIMLPDSNGLEVLRNLREMDEDLKAVIITGYPSLESATQAVRLGAFDYIMKPLENERVLLSVHNALEARKLTRRNKQLLRDLWRTSVVLGTVNKVLQETLKCENEEEVARTCLELAQELTESEFGLIGEVDQDNHLRVITPSEGGWSIRGRLKKPGSRMSSDMRARGIWDKVLRGKHSLVVNDPAYLSSQAGTLPNHLSITSFLGVPLVDGDRTFGVIALANKRAGYSPADQEAIEALSVAFMEALKRKWAEEEKQKLQAQLFHAQRMEVIGRQAGTMAHEFNNWLTPILGYAYMAMEQIGEGDPLYNDLREIYRAAARTARLIHQLLLFGRREPMEFEPLDINRTVEELLAMLARLIGEDVAIHTFMSPEVWAVEGDEGNIEQVVMNLAINARDAMPEGGSLTIRTENVTFPEFQIPHVDGVAHTREAFSAFVQPRPGRFVCLSVEDTGVGMDESTMDRLFEPFFTTKESGKGTGLGLSVVFGIVQEHEGWINVQSEPGWGSTFKVYLPASPLKARNRTMPALSTPMPQGRGEGVLLVEDNHDTRTVAARALSENGYLVFEAPNMKGALEVFEREEGNVHLVFSDVVLPDGTGLGLVDQLLTRQKDLRVLIGSGYTDERGQAPLARQRGFRFVHKPYSLPSLLQTVRSVLET